MCVRVERYVNMIVDTLRAGVGAGPEMADLELRTWVLVNSQPLSHLSRPSLASG